ncbi:MAG: hypothetical protein KDD64_14255 [Bdellovibrionales bacterium]|nr:hypothetical protein [Bdellovibrionales bacterium]
MRLLILVILPLSFSFPVLSHAAPLKACLKSDSGKVVVKRKCKEAKGFQEISAETLQGLGATQVGPQGEVGPQGPKGDQGPAGVTGIETVTDSSSRGFSGFESQTIAVDCPGGKAVIGYSCFAESVTVAPTFGGFPVVSADGSSATCRYSNMTPAIIANIALTSQVICAPL